MQPLLTNPSVVASLAAATISAAVAVLVMAATQFLVFKKGRSDFLAPKLEQLYLLLNELSEANATDFKQLLLAISGDAGAKAALVARDDLELYGHQRARRIIMYVRLYFPALSRAHQRVFGAERDLNVLKYDAHTSAPPSLEELQVASGRVAHALKVMEEEIFRNRDLLLRINFLPRWYRGATKEELEAIEPPPAGAPFGDAPIRYTRTDDGSAVTAG